MSATVGVCDNCNVVLTRDGKIIEGRPMTMCSHLRGSEYVAVAERDKAIAEKAAMRERLDGVIRRLTVEKDEAIAERDAERSELDQIREAITDDWMGRESMTASECVRRIVVERDAARRALRKIAARRPAQDAAAAAFYRCREDAREALTEGQEA